MFNTDFFANIRQIQAALYPLTLNILLIMLTSSTAGVAAVHIAMVLRPKFPRKQIKVSEGFAQAS